MTDQDMKHAFAIANMGIEVEKFIASGVGKYLLDRAEHDRELAIKAFKECNVSDTATVQKLQNDINIPDMIVAWLAEAIGIGREKHKEIREAEEGHED